MLINERNYLKVLQGTEINLSQVLRYLQNNNKPISKVIFKIRNDIRNTITQQINIDRKEKFQKIQDENQKNKEALEKTRLNSSQRKNND